MFLKFFRKDPRKELKKLLGEYSLPSFPAVVMEILSALRDDETPLPQVARLIEADLNLSVQILRTVNSAAFGLRTKVNSIQHAVSLLGRSRVESIVLSVSVREALPTLRYSWFDYENYWLVCYKKASLARRLAHLYSPTTESESFTATLLQDIGIPFLIYAKREAYRPVWERYINDYQSRLEELEKETFGLDHQEAGTLLALHWEFPEYLVKAIGGHHEGISGEDPTWRITALMHYAEPLAAQELMVQEAERIFGLSPQDFEELIREAFSAAEELYRALKS